MLHIREFIYLCINTGHINIINLYNTVYNFYFACSKRLLYYNMLYEYVNIITIFI